MTKTLLDLFNIRKPVKQEIHLFLTSTTTDTTIHYLSNHTTEHKLAVYYKVIYHICAIHLIEEQRERMAFENVNMLRQKYSNIKMHYFSETIEITPFIKMG